jgi:hypothetical protein
MISIITGDELWFVTSNLKCDFNTIIEQEIEWRNDD